MRLLLRILAVAIAVLLCVGIFLYSFRQFSALDERHDFNLYTLVPQDAVAVFETDRMAQLIENVNMLNSSRDDRFLHVSDLLAYLHKHFSALIESVPHSLSREMNKVLVSFHEPDDARNQILYCSLGEGDYELLEEFIHRSLPVDFPVKTLEYHGEEIRVYPVSEERFLSVYITSHFMAVSFQNRLIEQVVDAYRQKKALAHLASFQEIHVDKRRAVEAALYVRLKNIEMGMPADSTDYSLSVGGWSEFDLKLEPGAIYCTGVEYGRDSVVNFANTLRSQYSIEGFPGGDLPLSTFFYNRMAISDKAALLKLLDDRAERGKQTLSEEVLLRDSVWADFLQQQADSSLMSCFFQSVDTTRRLPYAVLGIDLKDVRRAEQVWGTLPLRSSVAYPAVPFRHRGVRIYGLAENTLLSRIMRLEQKVEPGFACFYRNCLLMSPDRDGLLAYIDAMEDGRVQAGLPAYEAMIDNLSPIYSYVLMADMERLMQLPAGYTRLLPSFFFRHGDFFRHFLLSMQFTHVDRLVYSDIALLYRHVPQDMLMPVKPMDIDR